MPSAGLPPTRQSWDHTWHHPPSQILTEWTCYIVKLKVTKRVELGRPDWHGGLRQCFEWQHCLPSKIPECSGCRYCPQRPFSVGEDLLLSWAIIYAGVKGNDRADRLAGKSIHHKWLVLEDSEVLKREPKKKRRQKKEKKKRRERELSN